MIYRSVWWTVRTIYIIAVLMNYPWELAQAPLFLGMGSSIPNWLHCFLAGLGDGLLVLLIFVIGWIVFRRRDWFTQPGVRGYLLMMATGLAIGISVEWIAVHVRKQWTYSGGMPLLPGLDVGAAPVAQMLLLPTLIFRLVALWRRKTASN